MLSFLIGLFRRHEPHNIHDDVGGSGAPSTVEDPAYTLWREASQEPNPYRREVLFEQVATLIIKSHGEGLVGFCATLTDPGHAEDIAQRACLTFWRVLPRFEGRSSLKTFLYSIAQRLAAQDRRDSSRLRRRERSVEQVLAEDLEGLDQLGVGPDLVADRKRRAELLANALTRMSKRDEREAWVVRMRLCEQLAYAEILPLFQQRFGDEITTQEGLRTAFFHGKRRLLELLSATLELDLDIPRRSS